MMYIVQDKNKGTFYDIRDQSTYSNLEEENKKLTIFPKNSKGNAWGNWWEKKQYQNAKLLIASEKGDLTTILDLLNKRKYKDLIADINVSGLYGFKPLHFAVTNNHLEVIMHLLKMEANINSTSLSLQTPLHIACSKGNIESIVLLIQGKANLNAKDKDGNTPIHFLSKNGWLDALKIFLNYKPDTTIKNNYGQTAIDIAGNIDIWNFLQLVKKGNKYTRKIINNILIHCNRVDIIKEILFKQHYLGINRDNYRSESNKDATGSEHCDKIEKHGPRARRIKIIEAAKGFFALDFMGFKRKKSTSVNIKRKFKGPLLNLNRNENIEEQINIDQFDIIQPLGKGSFSEVYLVKHKSTSKYYAMKVLSKSRFSSENLMKYAMAERNILSSTNHPFIVNLIFAFQTHTKLFLVLEHCSGYYYSYL